MKLDFDESQGTQMGNNRVDYPNGSFTISVSGKYAILVYAVNSLDDKGQPTTGRDMVWVNHNGQEYWVWQIKTHDGLEVEYNENGEVIAWDHLIGDENE